MNEKQHDAAVDLVAQMLWRGLEAQMKAAAADEFVDTLADPRQRCRPADQMPDATAPRFKNMRAPWRDSVILEAAERAAGVLVRDIDFANALAGGVSESGP